jgi:hypothetical protein
MIKADSIGHSQMHLIWAEPAAVEPVYLPEYMNTSKASAKTKYFTDTFPKVRVPSCVTMPPLCKPHTGARRPYIFNQFIFQNTTQKKKQPIAEKKNNNKKKLS